MFKFLKEKLKGAISKLSRKVEKEVEEKPEEELKEEKPIIESKEEIKTEKQIEKETLETEKPIEKEKKESIKEKKKEEPIQEIKEEEPIIETKEETKEKSIEKEIIEEKKKEEIIKTKVKEGKKSWFGKITEKLVTTKISYEKFEKLFFDLELILMENNVAMEVIDKIKNDLASNLVEKPIKRTKIEETIRKSLKNSIESLFTVGKINLWESIKLKEDKPFVIVFFGINGSGKTTSIAKIANILKDKNISCVLAASDTFRAASIEQLQHHADKLGINVIKHGYGSDPAAVAFDAIKHAKAKNIDVVLIDTAGRLHSQQNLMEEMKKIIRVSKPDLKLFIGEAITGNDCVEQAKSFNEAVGIDGLILTKADVDEKGGAAISVSYVTKKPIMYLGVGQEYDDLKEFKPEIVVEGLGL